MCLEDTCAFSSTQNGRYLEPNVDRYQCSFAADKAQKGFTKWKDFVDLGV